MLVDCINEKFSKEKHIHVISFVISRLHKFYEIFHMLRISREVKIDKSNQYYLLLDDTHIYKC